MSKLYERIVQEIAEWEQLSGQNERRMALNKTADLDDDIRNLIIAGGYISHFFPQILHFQPQSTEDENDVEYAPLICFLTLLADDQVYIGRLVEKVCEAFGLNEKQGI